MESIRDLNPPGTGWHLCRQFLPVGGPRGCSCSTRKMEVSLQAIDLTPDVLDASRCAWVCHGMVGMARQDQPVLLAKTFANMFFFHLSICFNVFQCVSMLKKSQTQEDLFRNLTKSSTSTHWIRWFLDGQGQQSIRKVGENHLYIHHNRRQDVNLGAECSAVLNGNIWWYMVIYGNSSFDGVVRL